MNINKIDLKIIAWLRRSYLPIARLAIFLVYFWFGILKLFGSSPAGPLAHSLVEKTLGAQNFNWSFKALAIYECLIGILFLMPRFTRLVIPMLAVHLLIVCSPLLLLRGQIWSSPFVPTLEGQYILKNALIVALAIGIAAQTKPLKKN